MTNGFNPWKNMHEFDSTEFLDKSNELVQWPIKLWQVPTVTPFFHGAHLLVAADCSAFSTPNFHESLSRGKVPVICCPAADADIASKLSDILSHNDIKSITVVKMESECCVDLVDMVKTAARLSRLPVPVQVTNLFITAEIVD
jgi:hypothetical protein